MGNKNKFSQPVPQKNEKKQSNKSNNSGNALKSSESNVQVTFFFLLCSFSIEMIDIQ